MPKRYMFPEDISWGVATAAYQIKGAWIDAGIDVRGYMLWTLYDNFEWTLGFSSKVGIVHLVLDTLDRVVKKSGSWYAMTAKENGFV